MSKSFLSDTPVMCFIATAKPEEAQKFYSETLGLALIADHEYSLLFSVNQTLTLCVQKVPELTPQQFTVFGWQVENIAEAVADLTERGVKFGVYGFLTQDAGGICTFENGDKVAWFKDPDGNTLSLAEIR